MDSRACPRRTRSCWCRTGPSICRWRSSPWPTRCTAAGYATASIGKWHLGGEPYYPDKHGFDLNLAGTEAPNPKSYFAPYKIATLPEGPDGEYLTDRLGVEANRFIEQHKDQPFFLYLPHFAVHLPVQAKQALIEKYRAKRRPGQKQNNAGYAAMIESMDDTVGSIRKKLEELKLADHTLVIFASDNGGRVPTTSNLPLRVGKGSCYEGGTRVAADRLLAGSNQAGQRLRYPGHRHGSVPHHPGSGGSARREPTRPWTASAWSRSCDRPAG